ncbi:FAD-binding oxidoreductase [Variovorax sp. J22P271]|uniref:FAD-binding oxidoreductase n=1 Tax=Variovorax davisae TaxID=3053515 RepID=UPI00257524CE|nr:FAD-binding oxidoreductase [Variovorax sp. J22P271]MDM0032410.1 FAD-binding oxidoreductase [Variovorax sp. J22P271]
MNLDSLLGELRLGLGDAAVLCGDELHGRALADWSGIAAAAPSALLQPSSPEGVSLALRLCERHGQRVVVSGGLTGLAGGANPQAGEVVLSLSKLTRIEPIDEVGGTIVVQAGVTLQQLHEHVMAFGWSFPLDLGARGSCQLGGNAATNAGGNRVVRFGMMREQVLGLEVALPDGTLLTMLDRVVKNNAGFDLKHLFIGSEGTLGVITRLSLALVPLALSSQTVLCALPSFDAATRLLQRARQRLPGLSSFELMWDNYFQAALDAVGATPPLTGRYPVYALIETLGADEPTSAVGVESLLEACIEDGTVDDAVIAQSLDQAQSLWEIREAIGELLSKFKPHVAFDVSVPLSHMGGFVEAAIADLETRYPDLQHLCFGHLGDCNLHLLSGPCRDDAQMLEIEELIYAAVGRAGGSISAEHGIGVVKRPFLHHSRDEAQIALMGRLKHALDPAGILNAGRVFESFPGAHSV